MDSCARCGQSLSETDLACASCHALRYAEELDRLRSRAQSEEAARKYATSRRTWAEALKLLPPDSRQAAWIAARLRSLTGLDDESDATGPTAAPPGKTPAWVARL